MLSNKDRIVLVTMRSFYV